ncbi:MAG TPA: B-box zinc finger protein [Anaerolineaceae bacterium]|nr:B-box zinc finger protein [Anaerolineaceae bacterium]HPN52063.1 B-box zinc finger protein [Anaerolineaceae bacterium]
MNETATEPTQPEVFTCVNHPKVETSLFCNRCERPICPKCAVLTPTGYRCKECIRGQQKVFETALPRDYVIGPLIAVILSAIGALIANVMGFFVFIIAPLAGFAIAEAVRFGVGRRRSRNLFIIVAGATALGATLQPFFTLGMLLLYIIASGEGLTGFSPIALVGLIWPMVYVFLVTSTVYYRLTGIQIR